MYRRVLSPLLLFVALLLFVGLACSLPTSQPVDSPDQPPQGWTDGPTPTPALGGGKAQPPPDQPPPDLPPAPVGMVAIPAGSFQMGCAPSEVYECILPAAERELPLHVVYLDGYYMDVYEVSNGQYAQCVAAGVCADPPSHTNMDTGQLIYNDNHYGDPQYANYPVVNVSWEDAVNYCAWVGKSLPTEAQWEKAARGSSDTRMWPWGNTAPNCTLANFRDENRTENQGFCGTNLNGVVTSAVGSHPQGASPYGVMDMAANVGEWVADPFVDDYYKYYDPNAWPANPFPEREDLNKVIRGGGWAESSWDVRISSRSSGLTTAKASNIGFRCVSTP